MGVTMDAQDSQNLKRIAEALERIVQKLDETPVWFHACYSNNQTTGRYKVPSDKEFPWPP